MLLGAFLLFMGNVLFTAMTSIAVSNLNRILLNIVFALRAIMGIVTIVGFIKNKTTLNLA
jgi:hypothetical protein